MRSLNKGFIVVLVAAVMIAGGFAFYSYNQKSVVHCTVTGKDRVSNSDGGSEMRVYTEDCGTLGVADSLVHGRFSSADTFGQLKDGGRYEFTTIGWRIPVFSTFPNILEARKIDE